MSGVDAWLTKLPEWAGTVPQWGVVLLLLIAVVRTSPNWLETWAKLRLARSNRNKERIEELELQVRECREQCDRETQALQQQIHGIREQRLAEQLSMMRAIVRMSGDPEVKKQLDLLEAMQISLMRTQHKEDGEADA